MSVTETELKPKMELPLVWRVQVLEYRSGAPWPLTTIDLREDGHLIVNGPVGAAYEALFRAARKATTLLAAQTMAETIRADWEAGRSQQTEAHTKAPGHEGEGGTV